MSEGYVTGNPTKIIAYAISYPMMDGNVQWTEEQKGIYLPDQMKALYIENNQLYVAKDNDHTQFLSDLFENPDSKSSVTIIKKKSNVDDRQRMELLFKQAEHAISARAETIKSLEGLL